MRTRSAGNQLEEHQTKVAIVIGKAQQHIHNERIGQEQEQNLEQQQQNRTGPRSCQWEGVKGFLSVYRMTQKLQVVMLCPQMQSHCTNLWQSTLPGKSYWNSTGWVNIHVQYISYLCIIFYSILLSKVLWILNNATAALCAGK